MKRLAVNGPLFLLLPVVLALASCTHQSAEREDLRSPPSPSMEETLDLFAFDPVLCPPPTAGPWSEGKRYAVRRLRFPDRPDSLFPGTGVEAVEYRPGAGQSPAGPGILILPIQGADYEVSSYFAEYFASRNFACLRFLRRAEWLVPDRDLASLAPLIREYVIDIRRGLSWWQASGHVDPERIGLFGVSMGAIIGSAVTALEGPNLRASVLVLGGGPLAEILMTADDEEIASFRERWMKTTGWDESGLRRKLHGILDPVDPIRTAPLIRPSQVLMIQGRFDHVVRLPLGTDLWEAARRPERILIPTGHYSSVLLIHYVRWKALTWFERWLAPGE